MRMLRVALVLFVLASFVGATVAVSMAATVTPAAKATMKPTGTAKPIKMTGKMIDLQQMKSTIGDVYKKLITGTKMPAKPAMPANTTTATGGADKAAGAVNKTAGAVNKTATGADVKKWPAQTKPSMKLSTPSMRSIPAMSVNLAGAMPKTGNTTAKPDGTYGKKMLIGLGI